LKTKPWLSQKNVATPISNRGADYLVASLLEFTLQPILAKKQDLKNPH